MSAVHNFFIFRLHKCNSLFANHCVGCTFFSLNIKKIKIKNTLYLRPSVSNLQFLCCFSHNCSTLFRTHYLGLLPFFLEIKNIYTNFFWTKCQYCTQILCFFIQVSLYLGLNISSVYNCFFFLLFFSS